MGRKAWPRHGHPMGTRRWRGCGWCEFAVWRSIGMIYSLPLGDGLVGSGGLAVGGSIGISNARKGLAHGDWRLGVGWG